MRWPRGHAVEGRVYAEDPSRGFLPQAGRLLLYREPRLPGVRVDAGFVEGDEISIHYDPLLAKVIASAETRDLAISRLIAALRGYPILGIRTNIPYLLRILEHPRFQSGNADTGFLESEGEALAEGPTPAISTACPPQWRAQRGRQTEAGATLGQHAPNGIRGVASWGAPVSGHLPRRVSAPASTTSKRGPERDRLLAGWPGRSVAFWNGRVFRSGHERDDAGAQPARRASCSSLTAPNAATVLSARARDPV